jgi:hypothetical protein
LFIYPTVHIQQTDQPESSAKKSYTSYTTVL